MAQYNHIAAHGFFWMPFPAQPKEGQAVRTAPMLSIDDLRARIALLKSELKAAGRTDTVDICMTPFTHQHHPRGKENYEIGRAHV